MIDEYICFSHQKKKKKKRASLACFVQSPNKVAQIITIPLLTQRMILGITFYLLARGHEHATFIRSIH